jgi:hypothetical protein
VPGQRGAVGSGALHPDPIELTVPGQPRQQCPVAGGVGGELSVTELSTDMVEHRRVVGFAVSIDAARDRARRCCDAGHRRNSSACIGLGRHAGAG